MLQQKQLQVTVVGRVQGVSFRHYARQEALRLGLVGFVQNQHDGSVYLVVEGEKANLEKLIDFLHHGPSMARVDAVHVRWQPPTNEFKRFKVRWF